MTLFIVALLTSKFESFLHLTLQLILKIQKLDTQRVELLAIKPDQCHSINDESP